MADDRYSLKNTAINDDWLTFREVGLTTALSSLVMEESAQGLTPGFSQVLAAVSLKLSLLTTALESLNLTFSSQRSLSPATGSSAKTALASRQNNASEAGGSIEPPALLKSGSVKNSGEADQLPERQRESMMPSNQRLASVPLMADAVTAPAVKATVLADTKWRVPLKLDSPEVVDQPQVIKCPGKITGEQQSSIDRTHDNRLSTGTGNAQPPAAESPPASSGLKGLAETALAQIMPLIAGLGKVVFDEMTNQMAKRVLGVASARLPKQFGEVFSEDFRDKTRANKPDTGKGSTVRVSARGSRGTPRLVAMAASMRSLTRRAPGPLKAVGAAVDVVGGVLTGNRRKVGTGLGAAGGGWAGATAGSALGATLGSVVPVIGTAIGGVVGGLIGGWLGSESGAVLGEKLAAPATDRLASPEQVSNELTSAPTQTQQINYAPSIQVTCTGGESPEHIRTIVAQQLQTQFHGEFVPLMTTNALATRRGAALTDGGR
ncbi:hypothetical protein [Pseudomonas fluorescens]|uniref:Tail tape measure protein n=1 Tax=Pseudomonas fluorescens TaxID=294 RepID=A0A5E7DH62_PSEFL|nr:hypothetical protein [Pseudomonas fluorescens]VVO06672.1 hypothetical protein PS704_03103 [Pseudomonas fluorescens]